MEEGRTGDYSLHYHVQVQMKESMVMSFFTNTVFFFACDVTVSMSYTLMEFQMVVLVLSTHSTRRKLKLGKSIEARRSTLLPRNAVICRGNYCGYDLFKDRKSVV